MKTIGERIRQARVAKKWSGEDLSKKVGYKTQSGISNLEGRVTGSGGNKIGAIADALNVSLDWLVNGPDADNVPFLPPKIKHKVDTPYSTALAEPNIHPAPLLRPSGLIPIIGHVKGGDDGFLEELQYPVGSGEGFVEYWTRDASAYALRVKGDSMHPRYRAGEYVVVTPQQEAQPGQDVVVKLVCGKKLLKQLNWIRGDELQLLRPGSRYRGRVRPCLRCVGRWSWRGWHLVEAYPNRCSRNVLREHGG